MIGIGAPGKASCHRMIIIREKPNSRKSMAVIAYWMPITLWSTEKTYVRRKLSFVFVVGVRGMRGVFGGGHVLQRRDSFLDLRGRSGRRRRRRPGARRRRDRVGRSPGTLDGAGRPSRFPA